MRKKYLRALSTLLTVAILLTLLPTAALAATSAPINATNFPDANFRSYVANNFDKDKNGALSQAEQDAVTKISVSEMGISDLTGISYFKNLESLYCYNNQLIALDVSKNIALTDLSCHHNQLTTLDVGKNTALTSLWCHNNQLTALDVTKNTALTNLSCHCNQLTTLDVSKNTALMGLGCDYNQLTTLDVSKNTALKSLLCDKNQLTALDVTKNTALTSLWCYNNQLTALDVTKNTVLTDLRCYYNQLTTLDISKNTALSYLECEHNKLTVLDVSKNTALKSLFCHRNQLTALDVTKNTALTFLWCDNNQLTALDVSKNTALKSLYCYRNQLTALDATKNTALTDLRCLYNQLTTLDISKNTALSYLECEYNKLTVLDVSKNTALTDLRCEYNQLTTLDVSKNTALTSLWCDNNQLTALDVSKNTKLATLYCSNNQREITLTAARTFNLSTLPGFNIAKASNWSGGTVSGSTLTVNSGATSVTYSYDCGNSHTAVFELLPQDHVHTYRDVVTPPTCTERGHTTHTCTSCGSQYVDSYVNALGHAYGSWSVSKPATCTQKGEETRSCSRCGDKQTQQIPALGHSYTYKVTTAPTTSAAGVLTGTCSRCSNKTTITLPKLDTTNYNYSVIKAATCTATGTGRYTWKTAIYGTFYFDVTIAKTAHTYKTTVTAPTCTAQGYTTHTCSVCGNSYKDSYTNALGHAWDSGVVTVEPTETQEGEKTYTCTRCGLTKTEALPPVGHVHQYVANVYPPTCTERGYTRYVCSCGSWRVDDYTEPLGHAWDSGVVTVEPTEAQEGEKTYTCTRCGLTKTETLPRTEHVHQYVANVYPPTCTEQGYTEYRCACTDWYIDNYTPALGHAWDDGTVTIEPTETQEGDKILTCTRCGTARVETIPVRECPSAKFVDVDRNKWYHQAVDFALNNGIFSGVDDTHFNPNGKTNRAMFVAVLWRLDGRPESAAANPFVDVKAGSYYEKAVIWAAAHKIVAGADATHFNPNGNVTREQVAAFLYRYANAKGYDLSANADLSKFPDAGKISNYAKENLAWAVGAGLISGSKDAATGAVYLDPKGNATRAQVAQILMMFTQKIAK